MADLHVRPPNPLVEWALAFVRAGDFEDAIRAFGTITALPAGPASAASFFNKAVLLFVLQRYGEVVQFLTDPLPDELPNCDRDLLQRLNADCGRRLGVQRITATKEAVDELFQTGMEANDGEQWQAMQELFTAVLDRDPEICLAWNNKAHSLMKCGIKEHAFLCALMALAMDDQSGTAWCTLGEILARVGLRREALQCFEHSFRLKPAEQLAQYLESELAQWTRRGVRPWA